MPYARTFSVIFRGFSLLMFVLAFFSLLGMLVFEHSRNYFTIPGLLLLGLLYRKIARYLAKVSTPKSPPSGIL